METGLEAATAVDFSRFSPKQKRSHLSTAQML